MMKTRGLLIVAAALLFTLNACGSSGSSKSTTGTPLPVVDVFDVATGEKVAFSELVPAEQPILLWFWAPL